jgi:hypothetical protein
VRRWLATLSVIAVMAGGTSYAIAADAGTPERVAEYQADVDRFSAERERVDDEVIRPLLRPLIRDLLIPAREADTLEEARFHVNHALDVLARPGPAESVSKTIHTEVRRLGSLGLRALRRHVEDAQDDLP